MEDLAEFCSLLGLQLDANKSYVWCNTPDGRKLIRDHNQIGKLFARDLGGHLNYSKLRTNCTLQDKIAQFVPFWNRLCRSFAAASQKERALVVSAWPNLFYGICTVSLGNAHFEKLRTSACRSLNLTQNGVNPMLQLSCVGNPKADPEYYCLFTTVMSFRDCHCENMTEFVMDQLIQGQNMTPGPCSSLLRVLHKIAWTWQGGGVCLDQDGLPCNILRCPKMELSCRLLEAWQTKVFSLTTAMRKTMDGLQNADARLTQQCLRSIPVSGLGLMRCALNGTQFTYDALVHTGAVATAQCQFCQQNDSQRHRHWECSFLQRHQIKIPRPNNASSECQGLPPEPRVATKSSWISWPANTALASPWHNHVLCSPAWSRCKAILQRSFHRRQLHNADRPSASIGNMGSRWMDRRRILASCKR